MNQALERSAQASALDFGRCIADFWENRLGSRLIGIYLIGSLAHGGFSSRYSDIDLGLIAEDGLAHSELDLMRDSATAFSAAHAAKLSLFWTDRHFAVGRFPPLDRVDYLDHAVPLLERERVRPMRPMLGDIRAYLRGAPLESWTDQIRHFDTLAGLDGADHKPYLRALLYPARFVYSWTTGGMASNDDAVEFLHRHAPSGLDVDLIERALECRRAARDLDCLFPERSKLREQHAACARLIATS